MASIRGLANARVQNVRQQSKTSAEGDNENINTFKDKFEAQDEDGALEVANISLQVSFNLS